MLDWVGWFHHQRLMEPIGTIPPAKADYCWQQVVLPKAA